MTTYERMIEALNTRKDRSAWDRGVTAYALELVEDLEEAANYYGWNRIQCAKDGKMRSIEDIHNEIFALVLKCLEEE